MQAEYFCIFVKEVATGPYPAPDEFNERPITPYFFIVHFNITLRHSVPSRCVTLRGILNKNKALQSNTTLFLILVIQCYMFRFNESSGITLQTLKKNLSTLAVRIIGK
jgi:hypothetical protein